MMKYLNIFLIALLASLSLVGCDNDGPMEETGENVDEAADDAGDATEDAADDVENTFD